MIVKEELKGTPEHALMGRWWNWCKTVWAIDTKDDVGTQFDYLIQSASDFVKTQPVEMQMYARRLVLAHLDKVSDDYRLSQGNISKEDRWSLIRVKDAQTVFRGEI